MLGNPLLIFGRERVKQWRELLVGFFDISAAIVGLGRPFQDFLPDFIRDAAIGRLFSAPFRSPGGNNAAGKFVPDVFRALVSFYPTEIDYK